MRVQCAENSVIGPQSDFLSLLCVKKNLTIIYDIHRPQALVIDNRRPSLTFSIQSVCFLDRIQSIYRPKLSVLLSVDIGVIAKVHVIVRGSSLAGSSFLLSSGLAGAFLPGLTRFSRRFLFGHLEIGLVGRSPSILLFVRHLVFAVHHGQFLCHLLVAIRCIIVVLPVKSRVFVAHHEVVGPNMLIVDCAVVRTVQCVPVV